MAKVNTNEVLKKHHFWILFGLSVLFVGLAFVFLSTGVSASIDAKAAANKAQVDKVTGTKPPGKGVIDGLAKQQDVLKGRKDRLWEANWEQQKGYFVWPKSVTNRQDMFDPFNKLKFGTDITKQLGEEEIQEFKRETVYQRMFEDAAATIRPTAFGASGSNPNNWQGVLRWVRDWGPLNPTGYQLWLLMEDVWVQRAMLDPIRVTNETVTRFSPVAPDPAQPLKRLFRSRVWDLQLEVADGTGGKVFRARLVNRTPQLQLLGSNNRMVLYVRVDPNPNLPAVPLVIEGEFVPGSAEYPAKGKDGKEQWAEYPVEPGRTPTELAAVEPVLDPKTVPVRRLTQLVLGQLSAKHAVLLAKESKSLEKPKFWPDAPAAAPADPSAATGGSSASGPPAGGAGESSIGRGISGGGGGIGYPGAAGAAGPGGGGTTLVGAADANKLRYLTVNDQIRRMPVAFTVVCDQMYVQDVLIAYANSPLRFEAVQYHWRRTNDGGGGSSGGGGASTGFGAGGARGGDEGYTAGGSIGAGFGGSGSGSMFGPPGGGSYPGSEGGSGYGYGGYGFGGGFGGFGSLLNSVSEGQANAGLVELSVYGIISLYEQYVPSSDPAAAPAAGDAPPAAPAGDAPKADAPTGDAKGETPKPDDAKGETPKADDKAAAPKGEPAKGESPTAGDASKGEPNKQ